MKILILHQIWCSGRIQKVHVLFYVSVSQKTMQYFSKKKSYACSKYLLPSILEYIIHISYGTFCILPEHPSSSPVFSGVRVARSLVFYVMLCRSFIFLFVLTIVFSVLLRIMYVSVSQKNMQYFSKKKSYACSKYLLPSILEYIIHISYGFSYLM
jgi:hypothetical protein